MAEIKRMWGESHIGTLGLTVRSIGLVSVCPRRPTDAQLLDDLMIASRENIAVVHRIDRTKEILLSQ